jgi:hypothetical protein
MNLICRHFWQVVEFTALKPPSAMVGVTCNCGGGEYLLILIITSICICVLVILEQNQLLTISFSVGDAPLDMNEVNNKHQDSTTDMFLKDLFTTTTAAGNKMEFDVPITCSTCPTQLEVGNDICNENLNAPQCCYDAGDCDDISMMEYSSTCIVANFSQFVLMTSFVMSPT